MRRAAALAAAALLALGTAACKPSSLTPFGIDTRQPDASAGLYSGLWGGKSDNGGTVTFNVGDNKVSQIIIVHMTPECGSGTSVTFDLPVKESPIEKDSSGNESFLYENTFEDQGRIAVKGTFTSSTTCTGSYSFGGRAPSPCTAATTGEASFTTTKTP